MRKVVSILMLISILFFISGCSNVDLSKVSDEDLKRISDKSVVCNEPYIRLGTSCCLDDNKNNICDEDETSEIKINNSTNLENQNTSKNLDLTEEDEVEEENENSNQEKIMDEFVEKEVESNFKELKLEISEKDDSLFFKWNKYDLEDNFDWYYLSQSLTNPEIEEKIISTSGLIENISENEYLLDSYTEPATYYFWVDLKLKNGSKIRSNVVKYKVENLIDPNAGLFQKCQFRALVKTKQSIYTKGAAYDINTESKCLKEFENVIEEHESFKCSDTIFYREAQYRETKDDTFETIKLYDCPAQEFNEKKIITISDGETQIVSIGGKDYQIYINNIFDNGIGEVTIGENSKDFVEIFDKTSIGNMYVQILNIITSARSSVSGYSEIVIGNYDFNLTSSDVSEICYKNGQSSEEQTSVLAVITGDNFEVKKSYCLANSTLIQYTCDNFDGGVKVLEIDCEYGCEDGRCLKITDIGCDKEELDSGLLTLWDEESMTLNNLTLLEVVEVGDGMAEIKVNGSTEYVEMCKEEAIGNVTILIHNTVQSSRDGIKGWMEFSYN